MDAPEKRSVVSGIGISRIGRRTGIPDLELTMESATAAIVDAGLVPADIDGLATLGDTPLADAAGALGIRPGYTGGGFDTGGLLSPVMGACLAVAEGRARHVLVYRTVQMVGGSIAPDPARTHAAPVAPRSESAPPAAPAMANVMGDMGPLLAYHAYSAANWLAMHCRRHMHLYGTTKEQLGWLAVNSRRNAALNPLAVYREPMTMDDYLGARPISTPFGLLDCDVPVDGSIAFVISAADHASDCPHLPLRVEAIGGSDGAGGWLHRADYPKMASADAAAQMWSRTDLGAADVDIAQLYDGFTFLTFAWLEALGLCGDGEAGPFVEGGTRIALDGEMPLNTYGGQLSAGRMHGYWVLHEACLQLRGDAGARQVARGPRSRSWRTAAGRSRVACCSPVERTGCSSGLVRLVRDPREVRLVLAPTLGAVPTPLHQRVAAVATPVPAHRVADDGELTTGVVDRVDLDVDDPTGARIDGDRPRAGHDVRVHAVAEQEPARQRIAVEVGNRVGEPCVARPGHTERVADASGPGACRRAGARRLGRPIGRGPHERSRTE